MLVYDLFNSVRGTFFSTCFCSSSGEQFFNQKYYFPIVSTFHWFPKVNFSYSLCVEEVIFDISFSFPDRLDGKMVSVILDLVFPL